jgi:hypothetical protein
MTPAVFVLILTDNMMFVLLRKIQKIEKHKKSQDQTNKCLFFVKRNTNTQQQKKSHIFLVFWSIDEMFVAPAKMFFHFLFLNLYRLMTF